MVVVYPSVLTPFDIDSALAFAPALSFFFLDINNMYIYIYDAFFFCNQFILSLSLELKLWRLKMYSCSYFGMCSWGASLGID